MDYAVIRSGGKQYRVSPGDTLRVEKITGDPGSTCTFEDVLLTFAGGSVKVGSPLLSGVKVVGQVVAHERAKKILVFKKKRRKNYRRKQGKYQQCRATEDAKVLKGKPGDVAKCFTKFQDAIAKLSGKAADAGVGCRYRDNGNGTVTDYDTGLQWEQKNGVGGGQNLGNPHDVDNLYDWSNSGTAPDGPAFTDFLARLNNCSIPSMLGFGTVGLAGRCDWRLPTRSELAGILLAPFPCGTSPCIDPIFGPTAADIYLSATTNASNTANAWTVSFADGEVDFLGKTTNFPVRAVRGGL